MTDTTTTDQSSPEHTETPLFTAMEARVLGALMEKQLTTPDAYPLTLNSLQLACNQKTSREPVTQYESGELQRCVNELQERKLIEVDWRARAARYDQRATRVYSMDKAAQALLCIMLLRGPQTLNELLTRTQRMYEFSSSTEIAEKLEQLCAKSKPHFIHLPRLPGQREDRYTHLFCGTPDLSALAALSDKGTGNQTSTLDALIERISKLEQEVVQLRDELDRLKHSD